jgi:tRNA-2-methylthio-N6-dimethylallyladenosine synthase
VKKVFIKTYGCQMNERDSESVARALVDRGFALTQDEEEADVILLNTCSVRDMAEQKAIGKMGFMAHLKKRKPHLVLGFLGCMAQSRGQELLDAMPAVDLVVGTQKYHRVAEYVEELVGKNGGEEKQSTANIQRSTSNIRVSSHDAMDDLRAPFVGRRRILDVAEEKGSESEIRDHQLEQDAVSAFVSIMQGCEMFCTFCIVPYTRGAERSRPIEEIVAEVRGLVARGVKEVTLLGQIVNRYGQREFPKRDGKSPFVQLLEALDAVEGLERIRYTSPHPTLFHEDLIEAHGRLKKLCEHVHLPAQSGSDRILKAMHRTYTADRFLRIVEKLRAVKPDIAITTDIIVGFPGETLEDFGATVELVKAAQFDNAFIFRYSERRNTPAAELPGKVDEDEKMRRNHELLSLLDEIILRRNRSLVGTTVEALVEGVSKRNASKLSGRTRTNKIVIFEGSDRHHRQLLPLRIKRATARSLYGELPILL